MVYHIVTCIFYILSRPNIHSYFFCENGFHTESNTIDANTVRFFKPLKRNGFFFATARSQCSQTSAADFTDAHTRWADLIRYAEFTVSLYVATGTTRRLGILFVNFDQLDLFSLSS